MDAAQGTERQSTEKKAHSWEEERAEVDEDMLHPRGLVGHDPPVPYGAARPERRKIGEEEHNARGEHDEKGERSLP